jgi:hypothetical protein
MATTQLIELNLFQQKNYRSDSLNTFARNTQIIGSISNANQSNNSFIIDNIPNNQFNIRILDINNVLSTINTDYVLQLQFEKIK